MIIVSSYIASYYHRCSATIGMKMTLAWCYKLKMFFPCLLRDLPDHTYIPTLRIFSINGMCKLCSCSKFQYSEFCHEIFRVRLVYYVNVRVTDVAGCALRVKGHVWYEGGQRQRQHWQMNFRVDRCY